MKSLKRYKGKTFAEEVQQLYEKIEKTFSSISELHGE